ncbi:hypothetical protein Lal_00046430 [Lupinus albus]|nr:hypothetical protein Lal_00046430 [Lupinus albus]
MYLNLLSPTKGYDQPCLLNSRDFHNVSIKYKYHTKILSFDHLNPTRKKNTSKRERERGVVFANYPTSSGCGVRQFKTALLQHQRLETGFVVQRRFWKSYLSEKGVAWARVTHLGGEILGYTEGFSLERELSRLSESCLAQARSGTLKL